MITVDGFGSVDNLKECLFKNLTRLGEFSLGRHCVV